MSKSHLIYAIFLLAVFAIANACTSSSTNVRTNPGYDQDYTSQTRSRQASTASGDTGYPQEVYHPPITLEMVAMNTGDVLKGEAYPIIAVVDNPEKRQLTYKWSVEAGTITKLPESMRADAINWEQQLITAKGLPGAKTAEETAPESAAGEGAPAETSPTAPPTGPPAVIPPGGKPAEAAGAPGGQQPPAVTPPAATPPATTPPVTPPADTGKVSETSQPTGTTQGQSPVQLTMAALRYALLGPEEEKAAGEEQAWPEPKDKAGETETSTGTAAEEAATAEEAAPSDEAAPTDATAEGKEVDKKVEEISSEAGEMTKEGFKPEATEGKLVEVPAEKEVGAAGEEELAEGPPMVTITTDQPYILWTPPDLGAYNIHCQVIDSKGNELTPDRAFPVTVTEPRPKVELAWNKTEKLDEDDFLVVEIRAKNLTGYNKGLFTLNFDNTKMSFRTAEQGAFFAKDMRTSIYYAQLPNSPGKVTLAISVDQLDLPKGDGVVARIIFKMKENVDDPSTLNITQETAEEARYILDAEGSNILPAVDTNPIYATEWSEPPAPPEQDRSTGTEGTAQLPQTPAPPADQSKRDSLADQSRSRMQQSLQTGGGASQSQVTQPGQVQAATQAGGDTSAQLQALQTQRQQIMADTSLSADERSRQIQAIDDQIRALTER